MCQSSSCSLVSISCSGLHFALASTPRGHGGEMLRAALQCMCGTLMWRQAPGELPLCFYLQLFLLEIKAELENVESIKVPRGATFTITVRFRPAGLCAAHSSAMHARAAAPRHAARAGTAWTRLLLTEIRRLSKDAIRGPLPAAGDKQLGGGHAGKRDGACSSRSHYCLGTAELQSQVRFQALLDVCRR